MLAPHLRKALDNERSRAILGLLVESPGGMRYSEIRSNLVEKSLVKHPQEFQRALRVLFNAGLAQSYTPRKADRPKGAGRIAMVEATLLGKVLWRYEELKPDALQKAAEEFGVSLDHLQVHA